MVARVPEGYPRQFRQGPQEGLPLATHVAARGKTAILRYLDRRFQNQ